jgi:hypothetical protein
MVEDMMATFLTGWSPTFYHFLCGAFGGLIGYLAQNGGCLTLPRLTRKDDKLCVDLGLFSPALIGGFVGFIVDHNLLLAGLGGYVGIKVLDAVISKFFPATKLTSDVKKGDSNG